ncbi:unnamed protein product [Blepharisma stoltei]|uniref:Reverse transcriptase zinc-binding domain-containing protein n=1 Tax=Blepharisma stoltei TaxID=1481888 RepID=A0AAU9JQV8_9CILI|nr:unnamed protein product [Blepharisma stoltei]
MKERLALMEAFKKQEKKLLSLKEVCRSCTGCVGEIEWISLDCPIYLEKLKVKKGIEVKFGKILKNNKRN